MTRTQWAVLFPLALAACAPDEDFGGAAGSLESSALSGLNPVVAADHPAGAGQMGVWYDATHNTFGTPRAATLEGAPAMRIDDGGFTNGVYTILPAAIPYTGTYRVEVRMHVVESSATAFDGIRRYQIGVGAGANAFHRGPNPSTLAPLAVSGTYPTLTTGNDTALGPVTVTTGELSAAAGDNLLIAFGTDVTSGAWNQSSASWNGAYVLVGSLRLVPVSVDRSIVVDDDGAGFTTSGPWTQSSSTGYGGRGYRFTSTGNGASASWSTNLDPGYYDVEVIYRAGTNRAGSARYEVHDGSAVQVQRLVDQRYRNLSWVRLGMVHAASRGPMTVTVSSPDETGSVVIADAVRFVPLDGPPPIDPPEMRMATITVFDPVADPGAIQAIVDDLEAFHYNSVAVHTRYRGDATYFPNREDATYPNTEPRSAAAGGVDVLAEMVERGHRAGIRVFAYVNTHLVTDGSNVPSSPDHVINQHPEWRTYAYAGGTPVVQDTSHDPEGLWLDPGLPQVRRYLADVVGDIASNYDIDGVILDRIRYPQTAFTRENRDFGYHPLAVARFNRRYREHGIPNPRDPRWIEFRQSAVTKTVGAIYDRIRAIDPTMLLLAFPIGRFDDALQFNYQDWPTWLASHRIDGVLPQIYTTSNASFRDRLRQHLAAYPGDRLLGVTVNAFQPGVDLQAQLADQHAEGFDGASPFRHGTLGALGYTEPLRRAWDGLAAFPDTPWHGATMQRLVVVEECAQTGATTRIWRVQNDNVESIRLEWVWMGDDDHHRRGPHRDRWDDERRSWDPEADGVAWVPPGSSLFSTPAPAANRHDAPWLMVRWRDYRGRDRFTIASACRPTRCRR